MGNFIKKYRHYWSQKTFSASTVFGSLLLLASLIINYNAGLYATKNASSSVTDIFLDNFPTVNVNFLFVNGVFIFILFMGLLSMFHSKFIPFILKSTAVFFFIRSISISLTHIGPPPDQLPIIINDVNKFFVFGGDLFFSGHTGLPFLMALIFWNYKHLRYFFIGLSIVAGITVLLGHLHYSVDVLAAFFMTYGIFKISQALFKKDYDYTMLD